MNIHNFKCTDDGIIRGYYDGYYCAFLDELKICIISRDEKHNDAFSITGNMIFYDSFVANEFQLTDMECYACIAHEIGHYVLNKSDDCSKKNIREIFADAFAMEWGLAKYLVSALDKMCPNDELTKIRISKLKATKEQFDLMVNKYSLLQTTKLQKNRIIDGMRNNIIERNGRSSVYTIQYATPGITIDVDTCDYADLRMVAADLNHYKK